jgi:hypothetical protein
MCKAPRSNNFAVEIVAHALLRAASSLHSTPLRPGNAGVGQECRRGTEECVRHICRSANVRLFFALTPSMKRIEGRRWRT